MSTTCYVSFKYNGYPSQIYCGLKCQNVAIMHLHIVLDGSIWLFNHDKSPGQLSTSEVCQDIRQLHSHFESFTAPILSNERFENFYYQFSVYLDIFFFF